MPTTGMGDQQMIDVSPSGLDEVALELIAIGKVSLSERTGEKPGLGYQTTRLLEAELDHDIRSSLMIRIDATTPDNAVTVQISTYHVKDPESGRVFHANLELHIDKRDVVRMRDFLSFLLGVLEL